jgi:hypothetical protein
MRIVYPAINRWAIFDRPLRGLLLATPSLTVGLLPRSDSLDKSARRNAFHEWQTYDGATCRFNFFPAVDLIERVVATFNQNIRQQFGNQGSRRDVVKDRHVIN